MKTLSKLLIAGLLGLVPMSGWAKKPTAADRYLEDPPLPPRHALVLANASVSLHETGRVALLSLPGAPVQIAAEMGERDEKAVPSMNARTMATAVASDVDQYVSIDPILELRYRKALRSVEQCRIEVARRQQVRPSELRAGTVMMRWTVQPTGSVRDSEVIAAVATDLTIAACVKRVIASWDFASRSDGELTVERTYTFRPFGTL